MYFISLHFTLHKVKMKYIYDGLNVKRIAIVFGIKKTFLML